MSITTGTRDLVGLSVGLLKTIGQGVSSLANRIRSLGPARSGSYDFTATRTFEGLVEKKQQLGEEGKFKQIADGPLLGSTIERGSKALQSAELSALAPASFRTDGAGDAVVPPPLSEIGDPGSSAEDPPPPLSEIGDPGSSAEDPSPPPSEIGDPGSSAEDPSPPPSEIGDSGSSAEDPPPPLSEIGDPGSSAEDPPPPLSEIGDPSSSAADPPPPPPPMPPPPQSPGGSLLAQGGLAAALGKVRLKQADKAEQSTRSLLAELKEKIKQNGIGDSAQPSSPPSSPVDVEPQGNQREGKVGVPLDSLLAEPKEETKRPGMKDSAQPLFSPSSPSSPVNVKPQDSIPPPPPPPPPSFAATAARSGEKLAGARGRSNLGARGAAAERQAPRFAMGQGSPLMEQLKEKLKSRASRAPAPSTDDSTELH